MHFLTVNITKWNRNLYMLGVASVIQKFLVFYGTWTFITAFRTACYVTFPEPVISISHTRILFPYDRLTTGHSPQCDPRNQLPEAEILNWRFLQLIQFVLIKIKLQMGHLIRLHIPSWQSDKYAQYFGLLCVEKAWKLWSSRQLTGETVCDLDY